MAEIPQDPKPTAPPPEGGGDGGEETVQFELGGGGGGGSSGGGSSSGGGGGGGAAPVDPLVSAGTQLYFRLWGQKPPENYIEGLVKKGLNIFEIEEFERKKPAFRRTRTYRDEAQRIAAITRQELSR